jgi:hypothetical protein
MPPPEPWLRGTHTDLPAVLRAVVHALELAREDIDAACAPLADADLHARPAQIAPVAFHLRHIARSLDRLLTYAEGGELSAAQLDALRSELDAPGPKSGSGSASQSGSGSATKAGLLAEFHLGLDAALRRIRVFAGDTNGAAADLEQPRAVGRRALPTTVGGLLVHCADHTQRHTGQAVTTAKLAAASHSGTP